VGAGVEIILNIQLFHGKTLLPSRKCYVDFMRGGGMGKGKGFFKLTIIYVLYLWYNFIEIIVSEVYYMTLAEKLIKEFEQLTEERKKEVIDFVEFVKAKEQKEIETLMDSVISENKEALKELAKL
jgi:hypothetical protein